MPIWEKICRAEQKYMPFLVPSPSVISGKNQSTETYTSNAMLRSGFFGKRARWRSRVLDFALHSRIRVKQTWQKPLQPKVKCKEPDHKTFKCATQLTERIYLRYIDQTSPKEKFFYRVHISWQAINGYRRQNHNRVYAFNEMTFSRTGNELSWLIIGYKLLKIIILCIQQNM